MTWSQSREHQEVLMFRIFSLLSPTLYSSLNAHPLIEPTLSSTSQENKLTKPQNFSALSEYVTPMGRILHNEATGLRPVNQRKMAKAIRRMVGMGFMPSVHKHPEILLKQALRRNEQLSRITKNV